MHGDDLHQIFVAFEALLVSFVAIAALARLDKSPERFRRPATDAIKTLQALPKVPQVRENSRPLGVPKAAGRHGIGLQNSEQRRQHPLTLPALPEAAEARLVRGELIDPRQRRGRHCQERR